MLEKIVTARQEEFIPIDYDEDDLKIFEHAAPAAPAAKAAPEVIEIVDDWEHDRAWVDRAIEHLIPPPTDWSVGATAALQREMKAMLKEQKAAKTLKDLGWYMPPELITDNLYQWIVELHSFDESLPIAKDLKKQCVSLVCASELPCSSSVADAFGRFVCAVELTRSCLRYASPRRSRTRRRSSAS